MFKTILCTFLFVASLNVFAGSYKFSVYEPSVESDTGVVVVLKLDGKFVKGSKVVGMDVLGAGQALFSFGKEINKHLKFKWVGKDKLQITSTVNHGDFRPVNIEEYSNGYGDAPITREHTYSFSVNCTINETGDVDGDEGKQFEIGDNDYEETAIFGELRKI